MAVDKLVDSTQLNSDLTSVANAIRTKSGGSSQLAFPEGFVYEIGNISAGDTVYYANNGAVYIKDIVSTATAQTATYQECEYLETIYAPNATSAAAYAGGWNCKNLKSVHFPKCGTYMSYFIRQQDSNCNKLEEVIVGSIGNPVTNLAAANWRYGSHAMQLDVTIYVNAATLADIPSEVTSYANGNSTYAPSGSVVNVIYKNSTTGEVITA